MFMIQNASKVQLMDNIQLIVCLNTTLIQLKFLHIKKQIIIKLNWLINNLTLAVTGEHEIKQ